ncbi:MAG: cyclic nucleotide-binding domain-containing protein [Anaerolineae bacterium]|nr:cyclic nucleotide-binding domain-containing protein [Anaerolineae bacterium]
MAVKINFFAHDENATHVAAGETIFQQGDEGDVMYGIQAGEVDIKHNDRLIRTLEPGDIFGEMAVIDREPRSAAAIAKTDCKLVVIDKAEFLYRVQHHPTFALFVLQTNTRRLREETQRS